MSAAVLLSSIAAAALVGIGFVAGLASGAVVAGRRARSSRPAAGRADAIPALGDGDPDRPELGAGAEVGAELDLGAEPEPGGDGGAETDRHVWARDPRIDRALGALPLGVVVTDEAGLPVYRNRIARRYERARHGDALVEAALGDVIRAAVAGQTTEQPVDLYGPPPRNLKLRGLPTYDGGQLTGAVVVIEDVTLTQEVDRVRKDFVANVSHELRTPIGAIGLLAETLRGSDDPEVIDRLAGRLQSEALRLGDMIDDLLALSKLESGQIEQPERMDLGQVVQLAVDRAVAAAEQRQIRIVTKAPAGGPVHVEGDQQQMVSAVANLLDNALKYSDSGAEVVVTIGAAGKEATVTVTDTGVGIPEAALKRIFERFYRVDDARSRATGGTGLGLSIVRHVVLNHRGTISVESTEGQGSSFTMRLPRSTAERATLAEARTR